MDQELKNHLERIELQIQSKSKDRWDKFQIVLGAILLPIAIAFFGGIISRSITKAQLETSKQIAQSQLTKDYVSMLTQAASKGEDRVLELILESLWTLKQTEGALPPAVKAILPVIISGSGDRGVRQAASRLLSSEDRSKLEKYFRGVDR
jgi:hypothetical protein